MSRRRRWAAVVDDAAVLDAIRAVSVGRFGDCGFGVGWTVWDARRPEGMPSALMAVRQFGLLGLGEAVGSREWDRLLALAGLKPAPYPNRQNGTVGAPAGDATLAVRDDGDAYRVRAGLLCAPRYVAVRRWDPREHVYRVVGWQLVYMLI